MPNWCSNRLTVTGDKQSLTKFKELSLVKSDKGDNLHFTMEGLYPTPKALLDMTSPVMWRGDENDTEGKEAFDKYNSELINQYGYNDWYNWRVNNWGTKWDAAESFIADNEDELFSVDYDTAWAPNTAWVQYVAKLFPTLKFSLVFEEAGMDFCGLYEVTGDDEELLEGELEYIDGDSGRKVYYNKDTDKYHYEDDDTIAGDEDDDFWPETYNPYIN